MPPVYRSGKWPAFLKAFLAEHPTCEGCGRKAATGHHVKPFSRFPMMELSESNIAAVCVSCHFVIGHAGEWSLWVRTVREDLANHLVRVKAAQANE